MSTKRDSSRRPGFWSIAQAAGADGRLAPYLGTRAQPRAAARATVPLPDGEVGYLMEPGRPDGCLAPCLATLLQVPVEEVPDPRIDETRANAPAAVPDELIVEAAWTNLDAWLADRGLGAVIHDPARVDLERWIGVCTPPLELLGDSVLTLPDGRTARGRDVLAYLAAARDTVALDDADVARAVEEAITAVKFGLHAVVFTRDRVLHDPALGIEPPPGQCRCPYQLADVAYGIEIKPRQKEKR